VRQTAAAGWPRNLERCFFALTSTSCKNHQSQSIDSICWVPAYTLRGETERAAGELAEARRLDVGDLLSSIARMKALPGAWPGAPKISALYEATYFAGLRKAGMPEE
jgi:hypothetical protein